MNDRAKSLILPVLMILSVAMLGSNAYLLRANRTLVESRGNRSPQLEPGKVIKSISGFDVRSNAMNIKMSDSQATVLLIYSPTCHFCEKNWPSWASLVKDAEGHGVRFATIDLSSAAPGDFVSKKLANGNIEDIHQLDPQDFVSLNLSLTPQTILIGSDSKVKKVWSGVLSDGSLAELERLIRESGTAPQRASIN